MKGKESFGPQLQRLSRREFIVLSGVSAGVAAASGVAWGAGEKAAMNPGKPGDKGPKGQALPAAPSQNPGFMGKEIEGGELLLWTSPSSRPFRAYRLNKTAKGVWRSCDGSRSESDIALAYTKQTGREEKEASQFLKKLLGYGAVVTGGIVVAQGIFPTPPDGKAYHVRLRDDDPDSEKE